MDMNERENDIKQFLLGVKELCSKYNVFVRITVNIPEQLEAPVENATVTKDEIWLPTIIRIDE
jgi:hypothetical protein